MMTYLFVSLITAVLWLCFSSFVPPQIAPVLGFFWPATLPMWTVLALMLLFTRENY